MKMEESKIEELLRDALKLEARERALLAERLLASLDEFTEDEADRLWTQEARRRLEAYRSGDARPIPADTVHEQAEKLYR